MAITQKSFGGIMANALANAFWDDLIDHLKTDSTLFPTRDDRHPITSIEVTEKIGRILGLDAYTVGRWFNGKSFVHPNKFFLVLLTLKIRVSDVRFNDRRDLIRKAIRAMVERIKRVNLKGGKSGSFDDRKLQCVRFLYDHPLAQQLLKRSLSPKVSLHRATIFRDVALRLNQEAATNDWDEKGVEQTSDLWFKAFDIYMSYRPLEWEFLHEV